MSVVIPGYLMGLSESLFVLLSFSVDNSSVRPLSVDNSSVRPSSVDNSSVRPSSVDNSSVRPSSSYGF